MLTILSVIGIRPANSAKIGSDHKCFLGKIIMKIKSSKTHEKQNNNETATEALDTRKKARKTRTQ